MNFHLIDTKGNRISEDMPVSLREEFSEYVYFKVKLKDSNSSVLYQRVQLMIGTQTETTDYIRKAIPKVKHYSSHCLRF